MVRGRGAPTFSAMPKRSRIKNGPSTSTTMSQGWRQTSAAHWLKKLSVRVRLLVMAFLIGTDDAPEDVVECGHGWPYCLDYAAAVVQRLGDSWRGGRGILHHEAHGARVGPAQSLHLRQAAESHDRLPRDMIGFDLHFLAAEDFAPQGGGRADRHHPAVIQDGDVVAVLD